MNDALIWCQTPTLVTFMYMGHHVGVGVGRERDKARFVFCDIG
ncbi:hypothetical protein Alches_07900 [Alicyclobacillus hesperidum subsp. aegles]|nr:hypothetical protein [Alicyclobacillus hesperidum]GLG00751.1 hypothetical protein Alches_07900 [Alicyclobacillus hesperidum subsp. aegles]